jgi:hypothetical protein
MLNYHCAVLQELYRRCTGWLLLLNACQKETVLWSQRYTDKSIIVSAIQNRICCNVKEFYNWTSLSVIPLYIMDIQLTELQFGAQVCAVVCTNMMLIRINSTKKLNCRIHYIKRTKSNKSHCFCTSLRWNFVSSHHRHDKFMHTHEEICAKFANTKCHAYFLVPKLRHTSSYI